MNVAKVIPSIILTEATGRVFGEKQPTVIVERFFVAKNLGMCKKKRTFAMQ